MFSSLLFFMSSGSLNATCNSDISKASAIKSFLKVNTEEVQLFTSEFDHNPQKIRNMQNAITISLTSGVKCPAGQYCCSWDGNGCTGCCPIPPKKPLGPVPYQSTPRL